jgi:hypothetical protein
VEDLPQGFPPLPGLNAVHGVGWIADLAAIIELLLDPNPRSVGAANRFRRAPAPLSGAEGR